MRCRHRCPARKQGGCAVKRTVRCTQKAEALRPLGFAEYIRLCGAKAQGFFRRGRRTYPKRFRRFPKEAYRRQARCRNPKNTADPKCLKQRIVQYNAASVKEKSAKIASVLYTGFRNKNQSLLDLERYKAAFLFFVRVLYPFLLYSSKYFPHASQSASVCKSGACAHTRSPVNG